MVWDRDKAEWYNRALKSSDYPAKVMKVLEPLLSNCRTALDVGAGCGALAIPLASRLERVDALEPSSAMLDVLRREVQTLAINNIRCLQGKWGQVEVGGHDVVLCANVPGITDDPNSFVRPMTAVAEKYVVLLQGAGRERDKFYFKELYPLLCDEDFPARPDYIQLYVGLHELGICANVQIIEYNLDQPFNDLDEAVAFWKSYLPPFPPQRDQTLRRYLEGKLERAEGNFWARMPKKSAIIWWASG